MTQRSAWPWPGAFSPALLLIIGLAACEVETPSTPLFTTMEETGINHENQLIPSEEFNIISYLYYYNGGGVAATDINGDGLADLYFTNNQRANRLYLNEGNWRFRDVTEAAGVGGRGDWSTGVSVVDVNRDGRMDIYVCNVAGYRGLEGGNELFIQEESGRFREAAAEFGLDFSGFATQAYWFDYDGDGDQDMYLLCHSVHNDATYGRANFREQYDPSAGDRLYRCEVDAEGKIFYRHLREDPEELGGLHGQQLTPRSQSAWRSQAGPKGELNTAISFQKAGVYASKIGYGLSAAVADFDENGRPDLYVCNDFSENDYLYWNTGDSSAVFREGIRESMDHTSNFSMGSDVGDLDHDGRPDLFTLDMRPADEFTLKHTVSADPYNVYRIKRDYGYYDQFPRNNLQWNRGGGRFSEIAMAAGVDASDWSWSALIADYDLDGREDIFVSNGIWRRPNDLDYLKFIADAERAGTVSNLELAEQMPDGRVPNVAFRNEGGWNFRRVAEEWGLAQSGSSNGAATADLDGDGDLDLVVNNLNAPPGLYRNETLAGPSRDSLAGEPTEISGAELLDFDSLVVIRWSPERSGRPLYLELSDSTCRYIPTTAQRGFQSQSENRWVGRLPAGVKAVRLLGRRPRYPRPSTRQTLRDRLAKQPNPPTLTGNHRLTLLGIPPLPRLFFLRAEENSYVDFDVEPLQPWAHSDEGPAVALGEVDGYPRIYIGGAHGKPGIFLRPRDNYFPLRIRVSPRSDLARDSIFEDVDATFFDADGDGDEDLYVVSGGMQNNAPAEYLADRLYLNEEGEFRRCTACLPADFRAQGSCVVSADFDEDGDLDLFVGGRGFAGDYGRPGESRVLLNDGGGRFSFDARWNKPELGMVTSAVWMAGYPALVVVGEWMPITLFYPDDGGWRQEEIPNSHGLWRRVRAGGDFGFAVGNWGFNSALGRPDRDHPLRLYLEDRDDNGKADPIITYVREGKEYTLADKDELSAQLPGWRRNNLSYRDFARRDFTENFGRGGPARTVTTLEHRWYLRKTPEGEWPYETFGPDYTCLNDWVYRIDGAHSYFGGNELTVLPRIGRQDAAPLSVGTGELGGEDSPLYRMPVPFRTVSRTMALPDGAVLVVGR